MRKEEGFEDDAGGEDVKERVEEATRRAQSSSSSSEGMYVHTYRGEGDRFNDTLLFFILPILHSRQHNPNNNYDKNARRYIISDGFARGNDRVEYVIASQGCCQVPLAATHLHEQLAQSDRSFL